MTDPEYVAIGHAARVIGVPGKTLRRWVAAGQLPVVAGQPKRVVRLEDARRLAALTGHQPGAADLGATGAGQTTDHLAEGVADDTMLPSPSGVSPATRSQLEANRDESPQSLIDRLREAGRTISRLEAELDQIARERDALRAALAASHPPQERDPVPVRDDAGERRE
jgi:hypothetical protein